MFISRWVVPFCSDSIRVMCITLACVREVLFPTRWNDTQTQAGGFFFRIASGSILFVLFSGGMKPYGAFEGNQSERNTSGLLVRGNVPNSSPSLHAFFTQTNSNNNWDIRWSRWKERKGKGKEARTSKSDGNTNPLQWIPRFNCFFQLSAARKKCSRRVFHCRSGYHFELICYLSARFSLFFIYFLHNCASMYRAAGCYQPFEIANCNYSLLLFLSVSLTHFLLIAPKIKLGLLLCFMALAFRLWFINYQIGLFMDFSPFMLHPLQLSLSSSLSFISICT